MSTRTLDDLFRRRGTLPSDTQQVDRFRVGQTYRYAMANGCKRKFRVIRIALGSFFGPATTMLVEYLDTRTRQYIDPRLSKAI